MKNFWIIIVIMGVLSVSGLSAQTAESGRVVIVQDASIDSLLKKHIEMNEALLQDEDNYGINGFRIQIFEESGNRSSTHAREVMAEFSGKYPDIPVYLTWQAPNFKVRIGDFGTRMEAEGFLQKIKKDYPIAWVIRDKIKFPIIN
ncbi:MAG TPA: SPOR domain-containing protein [Bacteroidales bacterium]|nr:SPOR domain-containing protein [Bacteroidales bacterium]